MKPIPPGYSEAADNAPIPGRPWWSDGQDAPLPSQDFVLGWTPGSPPEWWWGR